MKSIVVITGASRGIGRALALAIADEVATAESTAATATATTGNDNVAVGGSPSVADGNGGTTLSVPLHMVLIARSGELLHETAHLVRQRCGSDDGGAPNCVVTVSCHALDLSDLDNLPEKLQQILEPLQADQYGSCWLINNAGSVGPLGLTTNLSMKELRRAVDLNVTSAAWVSSQFAKTFLLPKSAGVLRIVNISSLCALEPFSTMGTYCMGKSGRDMFHSVLAKEHSSDPDKGHCEAKDGSSRKIPQLFKVLNYAPGPCETQMTDDLIECTDLDDGLKEFFSKSKGKGELVRVEDTSRRLLNILKLDEYDSGSHVDFYD